MEGWKEVKKTKKGEKKCDSVVSSIQEVGDTNMVDPNTSEGDAGSVGSIIRWLPNRNFGFIKTGLGPDVYFNLGQWKGGEIKEGAKVSFTCVESNGRTSAKNVSPVDRVEITEPKGRIMHWDPKKGFGFIRPFAGGADLLFGDRDWKDKADPQRGSVVLYTVKAGANGKSRASNVMLEGASSEGRASWILTGRANGVVSKWDEDKGMGSIGESTGLSEIAFWKRDWDDTAPPQVGQTVVYEKWNNRWCLGARRVRKKNAETVMWKNWSNRAEHLPTFPVKEHLNTVRGVRWKRGTGSLSGKAVDMDARCIPLNLYNKLCSEGAFGFDLCADGVSSVHRHTNEGYYVTCEDDGLANMEELLEAVADSPNRQRVLIHPPYENKGGMGSTKVLSRETEVSKKTGSRSVHSDVDGGKHHLQDLGMPGVP